ncbi:Trehalase [Toxocara canis]|uniref:Trehalase n=1 Tax=Toxocara canis TaxID=6265 RepID=A0A0B2VHR8_TOXCA|nr:Trehalase [Toxocara canis]
MFTLRLQQTALNLATRWISRNYHVFMAENIMWEKYDVSKQYIRKARGGEYENQEGFGWTNGVVLDLLVTYAKQLDVEPSSFHNNTFIFDDYDEYEFDGGHSTAHFTFIPIMIATIIVALQNTIHF